MSNAMTQSPENRMEPVSDRPTAAPLVDIYENQDEYLIVADLPGIDEDGLAINLESDKLILSGRHRREASGSTLQSEHGFTDYERTFTIPRVVDRDKVEAELKAGVLWLHLPKSESVKPRRIPVKAAN